MSTRVGRAACACTGPLLLVILATCGGCGGAARLPAHAPRANEAPAAPPTPTTSRGEAFASLEALAARGPSEAPLMRELLRVERVGPRSVDLRAERDQCVRALFAAPRPVRLWFADDANIARSEIASGTRGAVPPRGPMCAKKGESLHLEVEGDEGAEARAVIFAAP